MLAKIQKWGNSNAIRIPKAIIEEANIGENTEVEIKVVSTNIVIIPLKKHITLKERIVNYSGNYVCEEWDTGKKKGKEVI